jgi:hypothetical protein
MPREDDEPAEATKARREVMELVRVLRLRESGLSWRQVKAAMQAEINRRARR